MCDTCRKPDGSLDLDYLTENGSCIFGCGPKVDEDTGFCPRCKDHSANGVTCDECGAEYENWGDEWKCTREASEATRPRSMAEWDEYRARQVC